MQESVHLGTVGGTRVGLNWSVAAIALVIALSLATGEFPVSAPGYSGSAYWAVAVVTAVLFFASLLGHELSHAGVARRKGVEVEGIVLWALGGVAKFRTESPDAKAELEIAAAGPAASVGFALGFGLVAFGLDHLGASALLVTAFAWLAGINALLAAFNLLPAYPLDGGRVLRAALWKHFHDRLRATDLAARIGGFLGAAMILLGLGATFFVTDFPLNGLWLALIGWFVRGASRQEGRAVRQLHVLQGVRVRDVMRPVGSAAPSYATVHDLVEHYLRPGGPDVCPLVEFSGSFGGLVGHERLAELAPGAWTTTRASEIAWQPMSLARFAPDDPLDSATARLAAAPSHRGVVFEGTRLLGTLSVREVERAFHDASFGEGVPNAASVDR